MSDENKPQEEKTAETNEQTKEQVKEEPKQEVQKEAQPQEKKEQSQKTQEKKEEQPQEGKKEQSQESKKGERPQESKRRQPEQKERINIIRVMETNLDGNKTVKRAIRNIKGVSFMFSNAMCQNIDFADKKLAELGDNEIQKLEDIISNPSKYNIPTWMFNRRVDPSSGEDKHLSVSTMDFVQKMDVNEMKRKKTYKGVRHSEHLTVRGQRTRGSFRKGKSVGVSRKTAGNKAKN